MYAEAPTEETIPLPPIEVVTTLHRESNTVLNSCVKYARQFLPIPLIRTPGDLEPNSEPTVGSAILMVYTNTGEVVHHIGIVSSVSLDEVCFHESNYRKGERTSRCLSTDSKEIRGYWFPN